MSTYEANAISLCHHQSPVDFLGNTSDVQSPASLFFWPALVFSNNSDDRTHGGQRSYHISAKKFHVALLAVQNELQSRNYSHTYGTSVYCRQPHRLRRCGSRNALISDGPDALESTVISPISCTPFHLVVPVVTIFMSFTELVTSSFTKLLHNSKHISFLF